MRYIIWLLLIISSIVLVGIGIGSKDALLMFIGYLLLLAASVVHL